MYLVIQSFGCYIPGMLSYWHYWGTSNVILFLRHEIPSDITWFLRYGISWTNRKKNSKYNQDQSRIRIKRWRIDHRPRNICKKHLIINFFDSGRPAVEWQPVFFPFFGVQKMCHSDIFDWKQIKKQLKIFPKTKHFTNFTI